MKKALLTLLVAVFVLSIGVGAANAAWVQGFASAKKILLNAPTATLTSASATTAVIYKLGTGETLATNDTITITLGGGLKFSSTAPTIIASGTDYSFPIVGSATGATTANFRAGVEAVGVPLYFNTNAAIFDVSAVSGAPSFLVTAITSVGSLTIFSSATTTSPVGTSTPFAAPSAMERVDITASTNTADVSAAVGAYKKFIGAAVAGTAATLTFTNYSDQTTVGYETIPANSISASKVLFTIAGQLTGVSSISGANCTASDSAGTAATAGATTTNFFGIDTAKTNAYCVNTAAVGQRGQIALAPVFTIDGTTAQTARGFTAAVNVLADGTAWAAHSAASATAIYSITRNGSSFTTNSIGTRNTVKITDRSNGLATAGGNITITAYDANGVALTRSSATILPLLNNSTWSMTGTALQALFTGGTPMRYDFSVESSSIIVTNVKTSTDGVSTATTLYSTGGTAGTADAI